MLIMAMKMCAMIQLEERQRGEGGEDRGGAPPSIANTAHDVHREEGPPDGGLFTDFSFHRARQANVEDELAGVKQKVISTNVRLFVRRGNIHAYVHACVQTVRTYSLHACIACIPAMYM